MESQVRRMLKDEAGEPGECLGALETSVEFILQAIGSHWRIQSKGWYSQVCIGGWGFRVQHGRSGAKMEVRRRERRWERVSPPTLCSGPGNERWAPAPSSEKSAGLADWLGEVSGSGWLWKNRASRSGVPSVESTDLRESMNLDGGELHLYFS